MNKGESRARATNPPTDSDAWPYPTQTQRTSTVRQSQSSLTAHPLSPQHFNPIAPQPPSDNGGKRTTAGISKERRAFCPAVASFASARSTRVSHGVSRTRTGFSPRVEWRNLGSEGVIDGSPAAAPHTSNGGAPPSFSSSSVTNDGPGASANPGWPSPATASDEDVLFPSPTRPSGASSFALPSFARPVVSPPRAVSFPRAFPGDPPLFCPPTRCRHRAYAPAAATTPSPAIMIHLRAPPCARPPPVADMAGAPASACGIRARRI